MTETEKETRLDARLAALRVLDLVERKGAYSNLALNAGLDAFPRASDADRRLAAELVYGVLRNLRLLDHWIAHLSDRKRKKIESNIRLVLRISLYQLLFLDRIPPHAVLNEAGRLLKKSGRVKAVGFSNAVLRRFLRERDSGKGPDLPDDPLRRVALSASIPDWLMDRWADEERERTDDPEKLVGRLRERAEKMNSPSPLALRPNPLRVDADELIGRLEMSRASAVRGEYAPESVIVTSGGFGPVAPLVGAGFCHVMDEAAQLVGQLLSAKPGERVLDLCAAPGGKSLMAAGMTGASGEVVSVDSSGKRLSLLIKQAEAHGYSWLRTMMADAAVPIDGLEKSSFDRVLVDAPCSSLGVIRRHPEIRWRRRSADIATMAETARLIAENALEYVKPGGIFVFAVCTTTKEEGRDQLDYLVEKTGWQSEKISSAYQSLWGSVRELFWLDTSRVKNLDGFFSFRLRKPGG